MAQTISQYQIAPFTTPINGQPADADQVRGNDNSVRTGFNSHDSDSGIHFQSSTLALRPAAGTANRKWYTTDGKRVYNDSGSGWDEIGYLPLGGGTLTGSLTVGSVVINADTVAAVGTNLILSGPSTFGLKFHTNGSLKWSMDFAGHWQGATANTYDVGGIGAEARTVYAATSVVTPLVTGAGITLESTGGANGVTLRTNGSSRWVWNSAGAMAPTIDNTTDLGNAIQQVRSIYVGTDYKVANTKVLGARVTGWTAATGTATRTSFATGSVTLPNLAQAVKALIDDLIAHGVIGA